MFSTQKSLIAQSFFQRVQEEVNQLEIEISTMENLLKKTATYLAADENDRGDFFSSLNNFLVAFEVRNFSPFTLTSERKP